MNADSGIKMRLNISDVPQGSTLSPILFNICVKALGSLPYIVSVC